MQNRIQRWGNNLHFQRKMRLLDLIHRIYNNITDTDNIVTALHIMFSRYLRHYMKYVVMEKVRELVRLMLQRQKWIDKIRQMGMIRFKVEVDQFIERLKVCMKKTKKRWLLLRWYRLVYGRVMGHNGYFKQISIDGLIHRQPIKYYRNKLRSWSVRLVIELEQQFVDMMRQLRNTDKVINYVDNCRDHLWWLMITDKLKRSILDTLVGVKARYRQQINKIKMIRIGDKYWLYIYKQVPQEVIEPICNLRAQQKVREMGLMMVELYNAEQQRLLAGEIGVVLNQKKMMIRQQLDSFYLTIFKGYRNGQMVQKDQMNVQLYTPQQQILLLIIIGRGKMTKLMDLHKYELYLIYLVEYFLLALLYLKGPSISEMDIELRSIRQQFEINAVNEDISINERLDCYIVILVFQILQREEKMVSLGFDNIFELIDEIENGDSNDYQYEYNLEKRKMTIEIWQYWWEVFQKTNTKRNKQYQSIYFYMSNVYTDEWVRFNDVKAEFNKFLVLLGIKLWEIVDYDVYCNVYEDLENKLNIHPIEQNKLIFNQMFELFQNSVRLVFKTSSLSLAYFEEKMQDKEFIFLYCVFRICYFYNKHILYQQKKMLQLSNQMEKLIQTIDNKSEAKKMVTLKMKIQGPNMTSDQYQQILDDYKDELNIVYISARLAIKYCNYNNKYLEFSDSCIDNLLMQLNNQRDKKPIALSCYQRINYLKLMKFHRRPLLLIQVVIDLFQVYGEPFAHKIQDLYEYSLEINKAIEMFIGKAESILEPKRQKIYSKNVNLDFLQDFDSYAYDLLDMMESLPDDKYKYQHFYHSHELRYENAVLLWNYNQQNYFVINRQWKWIYEYSRDLKQNHPILIFKMIKKEFDKYRASYMYYIGITPYQMLKVIGKKHYGNSMTTLDDLFRIIKYKSYLRINALKSLHFAFRSFQQYNQPIMGYFACKSFIQFQISKAIDLVNIKNIVDENDIHYNFAENMSIAKIYMYLQKIISVTDNQYLKIKALFQTALGLWEVDQDYKKSRMILKRCKVRIEQHEDYGHKVQTFMDSKQKYFDSLEK